MHTHKRFKRGKKSKRLQRGGTKVLRTPGVVTRAHQGREDKIALELKEQKFIEKLRKKLPDFKIFRDEIKNTPVYLIFCHGSYTTSYERRPDRHFTDEEKTHGMPSFKLSDSTYILHLSAINEYGVVEPDRLLEPVVFHQDNNDFRKVLLVNDRKTDVEGLKTPKKGQKNFIATLNRATGCEYPNQVCTFFDSVNADGEKGAPIPDLSWLEKRLGVYSLDRLDYMFNHTKDVRRLEPTPENVFNNEEYSLLKTGTYGSDGRVGPGGNGIWFLDEIINYIYKQSGIPKGIFVVSSCTTSDGIGDRLGMAIDDVQAMVTHADNIYNYLRPVLNLVEMKVAKQEDWIPHAKLFKDDFILSKNERQRVFNAQEHIVSKLRASYFFVNPRGFPGLPRVTEMP
jgi:hypothetical protein